MFELYFAVLYVAGVRESSGNYGQNYVQNIYFIQIDIRKNLIDFSFVFHFIIENSDSRYYLQHIFYANGCISRLLF